MRADRDAADQQLVRAAKDADAGGAAIAREEQIVLLVDQDAGDTGEIGERAQKGLPRAVEDVDAIGAGVCDVHPPPGAVHVGVVEAVLRTGRNRDEADTHEAHAAATSLLHQA